MYDKFEQPAPAHCIIVRERKCPFIPLSSADFLLLSPSPLSLYPHGPTKHPQSLLFTLSCPSPHLPQPGERLMSHRMDLQL